MAEQQFNYDILAVLLNATSVKVIEKAKEKQNGTISDTDPTGAMQFTIAVVLVYGVGVIGLLGISARRNRRLEQMDKEVNEYIKSLHRDKPVARKTKSKRSIYKLISTLHSRNKSSKDDNKSLRSNYPDRFLQKSLSWTAGVTPTRSRKTSVRGAGRSSSAVRTILKQIAENQSEEAAALNESSPHIFASSSPTLHLDLSTILKNDTRMAEAQGVRSESVDPREEVIKVRIVTPREERQETVVNVSSRPDMLDQEGQDDIMHRSNDSEDQFGTCTNDIHEREMTSNDKCPHVVVMPNERTKGQHKGGTLYI